jgi:hypothetical protein
MLLVSSCTTYQYFTVDSSQLPKDDQRSMVMENDTMRLSYSFSGGGGPLTITVLNKTNQAIFIDWNKSALVCNDRSYSLAQTGSAFVGSAVRTGAGTADLAGTVNVAPQMEIVPGQTKISHLVLNLNLTLPPFRMRLPDSSGKQKIHFNSRPPIVYKAAQLAESQSPLQMKTYLTFVMGPGNGAEFVESHTFYVGKVIETRAWPSEFPLYKEPGDQFYIFYQN